MSASKFVLVDHSLKEGGGHHASYNMSIASAASKLGYDTHLLGSKFSIQTLRDLPNFTAAFSVNWADRGVPSGLFASSGDIAPISDVFAFELIRALERVNALESSAHVFIHSIGFYEIAELFRGLLSLNIKAFPNVHILCRRDLDEVSAGSDARVHFEQSIRGLAGMTAIGLKLRLFTDTEQLARQYTKGTGVPFQALPLPIPVDEIMSMKSRIFTERGRNVTRFCYLGDARDEKGYYHLADALTSLPEAIRGSRDVEFHLQSNFNTKNGEDLTANARARLQRLKIPNVLLYLEPLSAERYLTILCQSDAVIIPYKVEQYKNRSSSVFFEAIAAGCIPIVPFGTSMADSLPADYPTIFKHPYEINRIIAMVVERRDELKAALSKMIRDWRARHNPDALVADLLAADITTDAVSLSPGMLRRLTVDRSVFIANKGKTTLIQFDLESFFYKAGTARTMRLQTWALQSLGFTVLGLFVVHHRLDESSTEATRKPSFWSLEMDRTARELGIPGGWLVWYGHEDGKENVDVIDEAKRRRAALLPKSLPDYIKFNKVDVSLINYAYNLPLIDKLGVEQKALIVETHDLQTFHRSLYDAQLDFDANLKCELDYLGRANAVSCVTKEDAAYLRSNGIAQATGCIPIAPLQSIDESAFAGCQDPAELLSAGGSLRREVDIDTAWATGQIEQVERLYAESTIDLLFLGSWHKPNINGFDWFYHNVFMPFLERRNVNCFVIGGLISEARRFPSKKIFWGGILDRVDVAMLAARVVIAPIFEGTGINVKVLEAIEFRKPIVATSFALRGMPGAEKLGAFDMPEAFANRVVELLDAQRTRLEASREVERLHNDLKRSNDYRHHFARLLDMPYVEDVRCETAPTLTVLNEFGTRHIIANRLIRANCELAQGRDTSIYWYDLDKFIQQGNQALLISYVEALFVNATAPRLATKGTRNAFMVDQLSSKTADVAFFKLALIAIEHACLPRPETSTVWYGFQTIGDALVCAGSDAGEQHIADLRQQSLITDALDDHGFDYVIWTGPGSASEAGARFFYNSIIKASPEFARKKILLAGKVAKHDYLDGHVFFVGEVEDPSLLAAFGKTVVCPCEGRQIYDPRWLKLQLAASAMQRNILAFEGSGALLIPAIGRNPEHWRAALELDNTSHMSGQVEDEQMQAIELLAPRFARWLGEVTLEDCHWSRFHKKLGNLFTKGEQGMTNDAADFVGDELAAFADTSFTRGQLATFRRHLDKAYNRLGQMHKDYANVLEAIDVFVQAQDALAP